jgi:nicotinate-nucleotide pyrophosphorylase (carboxylating)
VNKKLNLNFVNRLDDTQLDEIVSTALKEDRTDNDVTTDALISENQQGAASFIMKEAGILAGITILRKIFHTIDSSLVVQCRYEDGDYIQKQEVIALIKGRVASILRGERVALNFLQRLCGIATETSRYVKEVQGLPVYILDTRKTTPGLRILEKYAVVVGGGRNHRMNLQESILIKDNHIAILRNQGLTLNDIILKARHNAPEGIIAEVEVTNLEEVMSAVEAGVDVIMLDNMSVETMRRAVELINGRSAIEASGGITLKDIRSIAETGVNYISTGALTHSVKSLDISLEIETIKPASDIN